MPETAATPLDTAQQTSPRDPSHWRTRAGQALLAVAAVLALAALFRPLSPGGSPAGVRLALLPALGLGVVAAALLASLRGRGPAESLALYAFLILAADAIGQLLAPLGWPAWPLPALLLAGLAVAESQAVALAAAAIASALAVAEAAAASFAEWETAVATSLAYAGLVLGVNLALRGEKRRLGATLAELARLRHGIDQLDEGSGAGLGAAALTLREVSEEGRRARQIDRVAELSTGLLRLVRLARSALGAHAVAYFDVDRQRDAAFLRAADGPPSLVADAVVPLAADPFAFVLDRQQPFYATDFARLLWSLPYYRGEVRIGTLLAAPVRVGGAVAGVLVADQLESQALAGGDPGLLVSFADLLAEEIQRARTSLGREELSAEFKAVYAVSRSLSGLRDQRRIRALLLRAARELVPLEAAALVMTDRAQSRYVVEEGLGWAREFEGREVGLDEKTWAAWVLRSAQDPYLLDDVTGSGTRMPVLVLDEGGGRAESLLAVPLHVPEETLGALLITGRRGAFDAAAHRVLGILANQAAALFALIRHAEEARDLALRDGLTGLYNRRAFDDQLHQTLGREDRRGGHFALVLLDMDHFKRLNDNHGHPAGDAALRNAAEVLRRHLRKGDQAARFGGEEFAVILAGTDQAGALRLAERVRAAVQSSPTAFEGARLSLTASLGVAIWPEDGRDEETLLAAADRALYAAKQAGRNRVVAASTLPAVAAG